MVDVLSETVAVLLAKGHALIPVVV